MGGTWPRHRADRERGPASKEFSLCELQTLWKWPSLQSAGAPSPFQEVQGTPRSGYCLTADVRHGSRRWLSGQDCTRVTACRGEVE